MIPGGEVLPIDAVGEHPRRHQNPDLDASNLIVISRGAPNLSNACVCLAAKVESITDGDGCQATAREGKGDHSSQAQVWSGFPS